MSKLGISAVFPLFNEEANVETLVNSARQVLSRLADNYEIILVDDGSIDRTFKFSEGLGEKYPEIKLVHHEKNRGYGASLVSGFKNCQYGLVFFSDGDNQFDLSEMDKLFSHIDNYDAVIGYREKRRDDSYRRLNSQAWNFLINLLFNLKVRDINCAFKLFRKPILDTINIGDLQSTGALINTELLMKLKEAQARIIEVPVSHYPRLFGNPTGANAGVILRAFKELLILYFHLR